MARERLQAFHRMKSITKQRGFYMAGGGTSRVRRFVPHPAGDEMLVLSPPMKCPGSVQEVSLGEEMLVLSPWRRVCVFFCVGAPVLLLVAATTVAVMLSIFSFRALLRLGTQFEGEPTPTCVASSIAARATPVPVACTRSSPV